MNSLSREMGEAARRDGAQSFTPLFRIAMTGALLASIPTVVLFFHLRRRFMEGLRGA